MAEKVHKVGVEIKRGPRLDLCFSPSTNTIRLAKLRYIGNGERVMVRGEAGRDVTHDASALVWRLVMAAGGELCCDMDDGSRMVLRAEKVPPKATE